MKYVYLDQMHWIYLAQAATGHTHGRPYCAVLDAARSAVVNGRAIFPISSVHVMETAKSAKPKRRADLARLMTELSVGVVLRRSRLVVRLQIRHAVRRMFGQPGTEPEPSAFGRGIESAFGFDLGRLLNIPAPRADALRRVLDSPEGWIAFLSSPDEAARSARVSGVRRICEQAVSGYAKRRAAMVGTRGDMPSRVYAALLTHSFQDELQCCLAEIGRTIDEWGRAGPRRLIEFWRSIPILHVEMALHLQMQRQLSRNWAPNDEMDIGCLSVAIPACDVVATERFWVNVAKREQLDFQYSTVLIDDLRELPRHIE